MLTVVLRTAWSRYWTSTALKNRLRKNVKTTKRSFLFAVQRCRPDPRLPAYHSLETVDKTRRMAIRLKFIYPTVAFLTVVVPSIEQFR